MSEHTAVNSGEYWDQRFQDDWAAKGGGDYTRSYAELLVENLPDWIIHAIRGQGMRICDWGCAEGEAAAYLAQIFPGQEIWGVDVAETAIKHAREKHQNVHYECADWLADGFAPPEFDVVLSSHVLEHFPDPTRILREVLAPAAQKLLIVLVPFAEDPARKDKEHFFRFMHENIYVNWGDWQAVGFRVMNTMDRPGTCWRGWQALIVYARGAWLREQRVECSMRDFVGPEEEFKANYEKVEREVELARKKLEIQFLHDQNLVRVNTTLRAQLETSQVEQRRLETRNEQLLADLRRTEQAYQEAMHALSSPVQLTRRYVRALGRRMNRLIGGAQPPAAAGHGEQSAAAPAPPAANKATPEARRRTRACTLGDVRVGAILDSFSEACFAPECELISFTPANWREVLENADPDLLFVESAWHGNGGAWQYRIASYANPAGNELDSVLAWCGERGIPTVFWNKEDPPNFDRFVETAVKFDYIFTTDAHCVDAYRKRCGHDRVAALPFAAQPAIHHPLVKAPRQDKVCFAGTYYADCFPERRRAMENLLRGGVPFGLDIFDRMHGHTGNDKARFQFPEEFQPYIRGKLDYDAMLEAYRGYRVFLNVNSVSDSPTMFARRVFEILACGAPVVSTPSIGIEKYFGDLVPLVETVEQARAAIGGLMEDPAAWLRASLQGIRAVMSGHTYGHRLAEVCRTVGMDVPEPGLAPCVALLRPAGEEGDYTGILGPLGDGIDRVLLPWEDEGLRQRLSEAGHETRACPQENLEAYLREEEADAHIMVLDARHGYLPGYLGDAAAMLSFPAIECTGMAGHYARDAVSHLPRLEPGAAGFGMEDSACLTATLAFKGAAVTRALLDQVLASGDAPLETACVVRAPFNFVLNGKPQEYEGYAKHVHC